MRDCLYYVGSECRLLRERLAVEACVDSFEDECDLFDRLHFNGVESAYDYICSDDPKRGGQPHFSTTPARTLILNVCTVYIVYFANWYCLDDEPLRSNGDDCLSEYDSRLQALSEDAASRSRDDINKKRCRCAHPTASKAHLTADATPLIESIAPALDERLDELEEDVLATVGVAADEETEVVGTVVQLVLRHAELWAVAVFRVRKSDVGSDRSCFDQRFSENVLNEMRAVVVAIVHVKVDLDDQKVATNRHVNVDSDVTKFFARTQELPINISAHVQYIRALLQRDVDA